MVFGIGRRSSRWAHCRSAFFHTAALALVAGAFAGCSGDSGDDGGDGGDGDGATPGSVKILDEHNYRSTSTLSPPEIVTATGTDLDIFWEDLTTDMQCHAMSPTEDIGKVALLRFRNLTKEEAAALLTAGELEMADIDGYIQYETKGTKTQAKLSDLSNLGTPVDINNEYKESSTQVYMLLWATGETPGTGARSMVFLRPSSDEVNTEVHAEPACDPATGESLLTFTAELATPLDIPADKTVVDWRSVTVDGLGNEIDANNIDRVLLAFYEGQTPAELEQQIFDIEMIATDLWEFDYGGGRAADLRSARRRDDSGAPGEYFDGFSGYGEGTWLLGLMCSNCQNPAPVILTVLNPVEG